LLSKSSQTTRARSNYLELENRCSVKVHFGNSKKLQNTLNSEYGLTAFSRPAGFE
jgi:hypothetical protein